MHSQAWWSDSTLRKEAGGTPVGFLQFSTKIIIGASNEAANMDNLEPASKESKTKAAASSSASVPGNSFRSVSGVDLAVSFRSVDSQPGGAEQKTNPPSAASHNASPALPSTMVLGKRLNLSAAFDEAYATVFSEVEQIRVVACGVIPMCEEARRQCDHRNDAMAMSTKGTIWKFEEECWEW